MAKTKKRTAKKLAETDESDAEFASNASDFELNSSLKEEDAQESPVPVSQVEESINPEPRTPESSESNQKLYDSIVSNLYSDNVRIATGLDVASVLEALLATSAPAQPPIYPTEFIHRLTLQMDEDLYRELIASFLESFNASILLFDERGLLNELLDRSAPTHLVAAICAIGALFSKHPKLYANGHSPQSASVQLANLAHRFLPVDAESCDKIELLQTLVLLTYHEKYMHYDRSTWIWNGNAVKLMRDLYQKPSMKDYSHVFFATCLSDHFNSISTENAPHISLEELSSIYSSCPNSSSLMKEVEMTEAAKNLLVGYPKYCPLAQPRTRPPRNSQVNKQLLDQEILISLVAIGKRVRANNLSVPELTETHEEIIAWWESLSEQQKLVSNLQNFAKGGSALFTESLDNTTMKPFTLLINFLYVTILALIHKKLREISQGPTLYVPYALKEKCEEIDRLGFETFRMSSVSNDPCSHITSVEILVLCYRAQNHILRRVCRSSHYSYLLACIPFMHALLDTTSSALVRVPQYMPDMVLGNGMTSFVLGADQNPYGVDSLAANFIPALSSMGDIWLTCKELASQLRNSVEDLKSKMVWQSVNPNLLSDPLQPASMLTDRLPDETPKKEKEKNLSDDFLLSDSEFEALLNF